MIIMSQLHYGLLLDFFSPVSPLAPRALYCIPRFAKWKMTVRSTYRLPAAPCAARQRPPDALHQMSVLKQKDSKRDVASMIR